MENKEDLSVELKKIIYNLKTNSYKNMDEEISFEEIKKALDCVDFSIRTNREYAEEFVKDVLNNKIGKENASISKQTMLAITHMLIKFRVADDNLYVKDIIYKEGPWDKCCYNSIEKTVEITYGAMFGTYGSINFILNEAFNDRKRIRVERIALLVTAINHELQHCQQFTDFEKIKKAEDLTDKQYRMMQQSFVLYLEGRVSFKDMGLRELYDKNHDNFAVELDAIAAGKQKAIEFLKQNFSEGWQLLVNGEGIAVDEELEKIRNADKEIARIKSRFTFAEGVRFKDNDTLKEKSISKLMHADYIVSQIIDDAFDNGLKEDEIRDYMKKFPSLLITRNYPYGGKKKYEDIKKELDKKTEEIRKVTGQKENGQTAELYTLYDVAISSDPMLNLEKQLYEMHKERNSIDYAAKCEENFVQARKMIRVIMETNAMKLYFLLLEKYNSPAKNNNYKTDMENLFDEALKNERVVKVWKKHPNQIKIPKKTDPFGV